MSDTFPAPTTQLSPLGQAAERDGIVLIQMLIVPDVKRSVSFYRDVLGASVLREHSPAMLRFGPIDVLVNNAGGDLQREFHNLTEDEIESVLELNLTSAVMLTRLVLPGMLERGRGHVVNVSSMAGRVSFPYTEAYAAAKDGLIAFTRVLRADYRDRGVSGSTLILGPVGEEGVGARTAIRRVTETCARR